MSATRIIAAALLLSALGPAGAVEPEGNELIGKPAADWNGLRWPTAGGKAPEIRGKAVLVRWWTDGCSLCANTAPALNELHARHAADGLVVVGVYHPKPRPRAVQDAGVTAAAERLAFKFPIAVDADWAVLKRWWLDAGGRGYTSVTFLVDRAGKVRWVHPGGEFHASAAAEHADCDRDYRRLREVLAAVLKEKAP